MTAAFHPIGIALVDLRSDRGRHEDVALLLDQVRVRDRLGAWQADHAAALLHMGLELEHIETLLIPDPSVDVTDADDHAAVVPEKTRHNTSNVPEPLDYHPLTSKLVS